MREKKKKDGGQAVASLSVRDYFAAQALTGLIARNDEGAGDILSDLPDYAYMIADAMLAARKL